MGKLSARIFREIQDLLLSEEDLSALPSCLSDSRILIGMDGSAEAVLNGSPLHLEAGSVVVILDSQRFLLRTASRFSCVVLQYDSDRLNAGRHLVKELAGYHALFEVFPRLGSKVQSPVLFLPPETLSTVQAHLQTMLEENRRKEAGYEQILNSELLLVITYLSRAMMLGQEPSSPSEFRLAESLTYLESHCFETIQLEDLSRISGYSTRQYSRLFQKLYGQTPLQYILYLRMDRACTLLRETNQSVTEIAFSCGFNNSNYFSRLFKQTYHISPSAFKQGVSAEAGGPEL